MKPGTRRESSLNHAMLLGVLVATASVPSWSVRAASPAKPANGVAQADFFVSPHGNDQWTGRLADPGQNDGPFATIARARDAVRSMVKIPHRGIRVVLRGGTYHLEQPVEFGPQDSGVEKAPVVYATAPGEQVVLSGGRHLEGGRWGEANGHKAWVLDIPEVKKGTWRFRHLFVNGQRCSRTRLPKEGEHRIQSLPGYTGDFLRSPTKRFVYAPGHIVPTWRNLRDVEVVGITRWLDNRLPIESVDDETRRVTFDRASLFALVSSAPWGDSTTTPSVYWVENVFEALDAPGQWYLDRPQGRLYYLPRPGEDMTVAEIIAPRLTQGDVCAFDWNLYWNASGQPVLFGDKTFTQWQAAGQDNHSLIADPLFVDPDRGDFRLGKDSPATRIGFEPWDLSKVGPRPALRSAPKKE